MSDAWESIAGEVNDWQSPASELWARAVFERAVAVARAEGYAQAMAGLDGLIHEMQQHADLYDSGPEEEISGSTVRIWVAAIRAMQDERTAKTAHGKCQSTLKDCHGTSTRACGRCDACCGHARGICARSDP